MPDGPEYTAGDEMTCSSNGYPAPTYGWTVNGDPGSTTSTQVLQEGGRVYICTATVTDGGSTTCSDTETTTVTAYSKYQNQYNTMITIMMLLALACIYRMRQHGSFSGYGVSSTSQTRSSASTVFMYMSALCSRSP